MLFANLAKGAANSAVTPDIVIMTDGVTKIIIDAKYKPLKGLPDRADLNQVITYGARYNSPMVMLLHASRKSGESFTQLIGKVGDIDVLVGSINLNAADMKEEEIGFLAAINDLLVTACSEKN